MKTFKEIKNIFCFNENLQWLVTKSAQSVDFFQIEEKQNTTKEITFFIHILWFWEKAICSDHI